MQTASRAHQPAARNRTASTASADPSALSYRNLPMLLLQARERMMVRFRPILGAHGLTEQQWRIIRALNERGPLESRHIADLCSLSTPSLAGILGRMHEAGLISKSQPRHDRRRLRIALTARSTRLIGKISSELQATYVEIERTVGTATLADAYRAVDALLAGLKSRG
ncbi:MAG TPA: homoprotocatechuate degradation operon regulator HpaR [Rhodanobacteraceae bacterium]|nr:homoprotocatechuate degradation operon regulator HpaR [Rhodanobacteraceae bacterium]